MSFRNRFNTPEGQSDIIIHQIKLIKETYQTFFLGIFFEIPFFLLIKKNKKIKKKTLKLTSSYRYIIQLFYLAILMILKCTYKSFVNSMNVAALHVDTILPDFSSFMKTNNNIKVTR